MQRGPGPKAATENPKAATEILRQPPRILRPIDQIHRLLCVCACARPCYRWITVRIGPATVQPSVPKAGFLLNGPPILRQPPRILRPIDQIHRLICVCACARPCYRWITVRIGPATVQLPLSNAGLPMRPPVPNAGLPCSHRGGHRGGRVLHGGPMRDCPAAVGAACGNPMHAPRRPSALTDAQGRARARPRARVTPHRRRPPPPAPTAKGREWIKKGSMVGSEAGQGRARPCGNGGPTVQGAKAGAIRAAVQAWPPCQGHPQMALGGGHAWTAARWPLRATWPPPRAILRWPWVVARSPVGATCATPASRQASQPRFGPPEGVPK